MRLDHLLSRVELERKREQIRGRWLTERSVKKKRITVRLYCAVFRELKALWQKCGGIAQLVEHLPCKQGVSGSIPLISTINGLIAQLVRAHA